VGAHIYRIGTTFELYAYCDVVLIDLKTALEQGLVSTKAVENAWKLHEMTSSKKKGAANAAPFFFKKSFRGASMRFPQPEQK
jgi:hypothetical protein